MYCPKCRTEYRPGFTICADCGLTLVAASPPESSKEPEAQTTLVTVFESFSLPEIAIARSILAGRIIKVSDTVADRAHALLADIERGNSNQDLSGFDDIEDVADDDPR
jgi:hypothetical protein